jgi:type I restriction enzyme M protein
VAGLSRIKVWIVPRSSEFRVYPDIRDYLRTLGWNTNNPAADPQGEVYDQHEFATSDDGLRKALGSQAPEHIVIISKTSRIFWVIEAKGDMADLDRAVGEARAYATAINAVAKQRCAFYSGIAGNAGQGYLRHTYYVDQAGNHGIVNYDGTAITSLLPRENLQQIIKEDSAALRDFMLDEGELLRTAAIINETLHAASINKDDRAAVVASILLTMAMDNMPDAALPSKTYAQQINNTAEARLGAAGKEHFADHIALRLPKGTDAQHKFVGALIKTADALRHINISAAMRSGTDVLGEFYEAFLKYGNGAKDLGIVLTPRHITRWAAQILPITAADVVFDPTCGTGGFLVSAYDEVRLNSGLGTDFDAFRSLRIFGIEQSPKIAALAVINMIFRGDGSANIIDDNALRRFLAFTTRNDERTADFRAVSPNSGWLPGATRVLMNPPFALKAGDEKEYEFVDHALSQTVQGGFVFTILPSPVMVKSGAPLTWRRDRLLASHTLRAVIAFPEDLFYPEVSVDSVGVVIEKGRPHRLGEDQVLWARIATDGYAKVKGNRMRSTRVPDHLAAVSDDVERIIRYPASKVTPVPGLIKAAPVDAADGLCELLPQVYLDEPVPNARSVLTDMQHAVREYLAFLIRTADAATISRALIAGQPGPQPLPGPVGFALFSLPDLFGPIGEGIFKGSIHALNVEDPGPVPVVSSSTDHNGILGFYDLGPEYPRFRQVITVAANGTPLTSFYHPYEIVPKDDVFVCQLPGGFPLETAFYVITALNAVTWRFSYYRKAYLNKLSKISIYMPVTGSGAVDHGWLSEVAESCDGWAQLKGAMPTWQPLPFVSLGKRGISSTSMATPEYLRSVGDTA